MASSDDSNKRPQFGQRFLRNSEDVFKHNAWDNVQWDQEQQNLALEKVAANSVVVLDEEKILDLEDNAGLYWDKFYTTHQRDFFKDRNWLFTEFAELIPMEQDSSNSPHLSSICSTVSQSYPGSDSTFKIFEVGCGVGNTIIPIIQMNLKAKVFVYGCDFSTVAIDLFKGHELYNETKCSAFVCDATSETWPVPFPEKSIDVVLFIFALSAINPEKVGDVLKRAFAYLKPGGYVLFRDYGRYDMAQLRFKKGRCCGENFYVRGDGTRAYFFSEEELDQLMTGAGLAKVQLTVDRRLQVNRSKQTKMYRVWMQAKYKKPVEADQSTEVNSSKMP